MDRIKSYYLILRRVAIKADLQEGESTESVPRTVLRATAYIKWTRSPKSSSPVKSQTVLESSDSDEEEMVPEKRVVAPEISSISDSFWDSLQSDESPSRPLSQIAVNSPQRSTNSKDVNASPGSSGRKEKKSKDFIDDLFGGLI